MGMYAVEMADNGDLDALSDAARDARAVAMARRRQLSQGKQPLNGGGDLLVVDAEAPPAASNGQGAPNGGDGAPAATFVATDGAETGVHLGRAIAMQRRRQLSQGKQAPTGDGDQTAAAAGDGAGAPPAASDGQGAPNGGQVVPEGTLVVADGAAAAHLGRAIAMQRRRQLSGGTQAPPAASNAQGAPSGGQGAPGGTSAASDGRAVAMQRRRRQSLGKQALSGDGDQTAAADGAGAPSAAEDLHVDGAGSGREQARARRAEASRFGSAGISRPKQEGRVTHPPKVIVSPTYGDQRVTGLRIGPGMRVTGDEPGTTKPVSGSQYVAADGSARALGAGPKVGLARTPQGLVVSGTMVRSKVPITGDEFGEHLPITGEAEQKFHDDVTPRSDGMYRAAQFPRRADPHGATAVVNRLALRSSGGHGLPLENTDGGLAVTGTAVGRSGRVTGNEAGACRPITGDQYQHPSSFSSECGGIGGGTAPAAHLNQPRPDPVTAGKVTVAQTWGGQHVTGPDVEHHPGVTGDEPGVCRPLTGTPYQGPSTAFAWCDPHEAEPAAQRLEPRPEGVAVTGDVPMATEVVTGTTEIGPGNGQANTVTGTPYYRDLRPAEPAADDWAGRRGFPVALARRMAGGENGDAASQENGSPALPVSTVPGGITGNFASGDGKVTGNDEFLFVPRPKRDGMQPAVTGEGRTEGRTVTGSAWTVHERVTGTEGYIAAVRNPSEGGGGPNGWAGARRFKDLATPGGLRSESVVTGVAGWGPKAAARITVSGGAPG